MANPNTYISGHIGTDIESRKVGDGKVVRFRLITNDRRNIDGEWQDVDTSGWNVEAWDRLADKVLEHLEKGDPIMVYGRMTEDRYENAEGQKRSSVVLRAFEVGLNVQLAK